MALLQLQNITKIYKNAAGFEIPALKDINLEIQPGEFLAVMGHSGSGKSTLLNIIGLLDRPTGGEYNLDNEYVQDMNDKTLSNLRNKKIGFIFQSFNLLLHINVIENVELPLMYAGTPAGERRKRAIAALESVQLGHRLTHKPLELSGGEMQRTAIARALVNDPALILADEPTGNLDTGTGSEIVRLLVELNKTGRTIIAVTHSQEVAANTQRIIRLQDGRMII